MCMMRLLRGWLSRTEQRRRTAVLARHASVSLATPTNEKRQRGAQGGPCIPRRPRAAVPSTVFSPPLSTQRHIFCVRVNSLSLALAFVQMLRVALCVAVALAFGVSVLAQTQTSTPSFGNITLATLGPKTLPASSLCQPELQYYSNASNPVPRRYGNALATTHRVLARGFPASVDGWNNFSTICISACQAAPTCNFLFLRDLGTSYLCYGLSVAGSPVSTAVGVISESWKIRKLSHVILLAIPFLA